MYAAHAPPRRCLAVETVTEFCTPRSLRERASCLIFRARKSRGRTDGLSTCANAGCHTARTGKLASDFKHEGCFRSERGVQNPDWAAGGGRQPATARYSGSSPSKKRVADDREGNLPAVLTRLVPDPVAGLDGNVGSVYIHAKQPCVDLLTRDGLEAAVCVRVIANIVPS